MATQMTQPTRTTRTTQVTQTVPMHSPAVVRQVAAIFLMAAGWGWTAGNFVQPLNTPWGPIADAIHVLPLALLLPLSLRLVGAAMAGIASRGARNGITALALYAIIGCVVMIVLGVTNPDPNSVGVHTAEDWMPVIVLNAGTLLWLATLLPARRGM
jgi:hypothetical protein